MTKAEFDAIKAEAVDALQLTPADWLAILGPNLDSTGKPQDLLNTSGQITEASASQVQLNTSYNYKVQLDSANIPRFTAIDALTASDTALKYTRRRIGTTGAAALSGGTLANHALVPAVASYKGVIEVFGVWCDSAQTITFTFQDEDDVALTGSPGTFNLGAFGAGEMKPINPPLRMIGATANKVLEVDFAGGAGTENVWVGYLYGYEL